MHWLAVNMIFDVVQAHYEANEWSQPLNEEETLSMGLQWRSDNLIKL